MPGALSSELSPPLKLAILLPAEHTKASPYYKCLHQGHPWGRGLRSRQSIRCGPDPAYTHSILLYKGETSTVP